jgi:hypothetical protein
MRIAASSCGWWHPTGGCGALVVASLAAVPASAAVSIEAPVPYSVVQRMPLPAKQAVGAGSAQAPLEWGLVNVRARTDWRASTTLEWRVRLLPGCTGKETDWSALGVAGTDGTVAGAAGVPAGGWYRLELRRAGDATVAASVEPVGVGEVFLIAGQSYAANCNEERLKVADPERRVACLDPKTGAWRVADDPQPGASSYMDGGTIWPAFGDGLAAALKLPVGFANVAWQGTSSGRWMPGGNLHKSMVVAARGLGRCRAVLWQQGESDVMAGIPAETYVANVTAIRAALAKEAGLDVVWLPAKSTIHPTVYNKPKQEAVIREAIERLWKTSGFAPGPDTDTLDGKHRQMGGCSHFSAIGQRRAAALWVNAVTNLIAPADVRANHEK